jgi:hypothetical protein
VWDVSAELDHLELQRRGDRGGQLHLVQRGDQQGPGVDHHVPASFGDNVFLTGLGWQVPVPGLPGGIQNVTWRGDFTVAPGMSMSWQWAAAVYTQFVPEPPLGSDEATNSYTTLDVKVVHSATLDAYHNGDQVGTPENRTIPPTPQPMNGARGGGASNFTGSYSATGHCP